MKLRILHTADNHIGISFNQYPEVRERLLEERFEALGRLVATANEREAHFFVVAGDLFDKQSVTKAQVERTVKILNAFEGEAARLPPLHTGAGQRPGAGCLRDREALSGRDFAEHLTRTAYTRHWHTKPPSEFEQKFSLLN